MNFNDEDIDTIPNPNAIYNCSQCEDSSGMTYLMKLCMMTNKYSYLNDKINIYLSNNKEEINKQNTEGWTALMLAVANSNKYSTEETVKILLENNADTNLQDCNGCTALMWASRSSNTDSTEGTVKLLLESGANVNSQSNFGWTALTTASCRSNTDSTEGTIKLLLKNHIRKKHNLVFVASQIKNIQNYDYDSLNKYIKKLLIIQHNKAKFI